MKYENLEEASSLFKKIQSAQSMIVELTSGKPMTITMPGGDGFKGFQVTHTIPSLNILLMRHYEDIIKDCMTKLRELGVRVRGPLGVGEIEEGEKNEA